MYKLWTQLAIDLHNNIMFLICKKKQEGLFEMKYQMSLMQIMQLDSHYRCCDSIAASCCIYVIHGHFLCKCLAFCTWCNFVQIPKTLTLFTAFAVYLLLAVVFCIVTLLTGNHY